MITGFANITIGTTDLQRATLEHELFLGRAPSRCDAHSSDFDLSNLVLRLEPSDQTGIISLGFRTEELERAQIRMHRFGLLNEAGAATGTIKDQEPNQLKLSADKTCSLSLSITGNTTEVAAQDQAKSDFKDTITGLDHIVIQSDNPERTAFLLGCQLGLDMRLDRTNEAWNARLLFFRCGDAIVEVFHPLKAKERLDHDRFFGITWRVDDIHAAHARLSESGVAVSEIRPGRKPGTAVCTIKSHAAGIPTLLISNSPHT